MSPVIATILMVAITVVLAAVLYVMVSGLVGNPGQTPRAIGVAVSKTGDGSNWALTLSDVQVSKAPSAIYLTVFAADGSVSLTRTAFASLSGNETYVQVGSGNVAAGDKILLDVTTYPAGSEFQISDDDGILAQGTLQ